MKSVTMYVPYTWVLFVKLVGLIVVYYTLLYTNLVFEVISKAHLNLADGANSKRKLSRIYSIFVNKKNDA